MFGSIYTLLTECYDDVGSKRGLFQFASTSFENPILPLHLMIKRNHLQIGSKGESERSDKLAAKAAGRVVVEMVMHTIEAAHLSKSYKTAGRRVDVLHHVSLNIGRGEMTAVMGPSGSGKTTLLHILMGIERADEGEIFLGGQNLAEMKEEELAVLRRRNMGIVFQDFQLLESLTVKENVLMPLILEREGYRRQESKFSGIAKTLGIEDLANKGIAELSGGQKQRVAIDRALIHEPQILFADEPTGSLDWQTTNEVMKCLAEMNQKLGVSILLVTHDAYAASFCQRALFLQDGAFAAEIKKKDAGDFQEEIVRRLCQRRAEG